MSLFELFKKSFKKQTFGYLIYDRLGAMDTNEYYYADITIWM